MYEICLFCLVLIKIEIIKIINWFWRIMVWKKCVDVFFIFLILLIKCILNKMGIFYVYIYYYSMVLIIFSLSVV